MTRYAHPCKFAECITWVELVVWCNLRAKERPPSAADVVGNVRDSVLLRWGRVVNVPETFGSNGLGGNETTA